MPTNLGAEKCQGAGVRTCLHTCTSQGRELKPGTPVNPHEVLHSGLCKDMSMNISTKVEEFAISEIRASYFDSWKFYPGLCLHFSHTVENSRFT